MKEKLKKQIKSFAYAANGIKLGLRERHLKIHFFFTFIVILASFLLNISFLEWIIILLFIALVISAELFNTALETICNLLKDELKLDFEATHAARDLSAAAVFVLAIAAALIGLLIFLPKLINLLI